MLSSNHINIIIEILSAKNPDYVKVHDILVQNFHKLDENQVDPDIFAMHKSQLKIAIQMLMNDLRLKSAWQRNEDSDDEDRLVSVYYFLFEKLNLVPFSRIIIQQCIDQINLYAIYHNEFYEKTLLENCTSSKTTEKSQENTADTCSCRVF